MSLTREQAERTGQKRIEVLLSATEYALLKEQARIDGGMGLSTWIRFMALREARVGAK